MFVVWKRIADPKPPQARLAGVGHVTRPPACNSYGRKQNARAPVPRRGSNDDVKQSHSASQCQGLLVLETLGSRGVRFARIRKLDLAAMVATDFATTVSGEPARLCDQH